jgi:hypothetical protein
MRGTDIYTVSIGCRNVHQIMDEQKNHLEMEGGRSESN